MYNVYESGRCVGAYLSRAAVRMAIQLFGREALVITYSDGSACEEF